ncbi:O-antigen/teichoic acid export membrane protein [Microbacterium sp. SORGH_AS428]|uniref:lipopolysaccharide biosynthesis protein n=1 Tax=Microbacterium sp. SORGH_AS_0428 TaxID=3041788 RepID=UPI00285BCCB6|nr:oligosaccharide flippase family protein [Microbacterium sp. SORGH_AS_0428]MDR6199299.1 O-antigen/teichoic acid export membrane protein [Microbacterium sp. SORGH_AS_0428]
MALSDTRRNALAYYANTVVLAVLGILINPVLLSSLGAANFGTWKSLQRAFDVGGAANGGAMQALKWVIAFRAKDPDVERKRRDVGASLIVLARWSPVLIGVSAVLVVMTPLLLNDVPQEQVGPAYVTAGVLGLNVVLASVVALPDAALIGTNQGYRSMSVTTVVLTASNLAMLAAALSGAGIVALGFVMLAGTGLNGAVTLWVARRKIPWWGVARASRQDVRELSRFSGWVLAWSLVDRATLATELLLVGILVGVVAAASYSFTSYVVVFSIAICQLTTSVMMPPLGRHVGAGEWRLAARTARRARELTIAVVGFVAGMNLLLNGAFVSIWAGREQFLGADVNALMTLTFVQLALIRMDAQIQDTGLNIRRKVQVGALASAAGVILACAAYLAMGTIWSIFLGLLIGRSVASLIFPAQANKVVRGGDWPWVRVILLMVALVFAYLVGREVAPDSWAALVLVGLGSLVLWGTVVTFIALSPRTLRDLFMRGGDHGKGD